MNDVTLTRVGSVLILHRDNPDREEIRRRLELLLMAEMPYSGLVEVWPGEGADEVFWRRLG